MDPLIELTFANRHYDGGLTPHSDAGCDAFGRYGQAVLDQYGDQIRWLEVWNEYNGTWCEGPAAKDRPKSYAKLLKHAYEHIKAKRPDVQVLGGAAVVIPLPYFEGIFKHGGLDFMDALVVHPYRGSPEGVDRELDELKALVRKYNDGKDKPIWVTETGSTNKVEHDWERGRQMYERGRQYTARYLARQYVLLLKADVEKIFWYLCSDHSGFVTMGLLRNQDEPSGMGSHAVAAPYVAYATLIRQLDGLRYVRREAEREYSRAYCLRFQGQDSEVRTMWAVRPSAFIVHADGPLTVVDLMGGEQVLEPVDGRVRIAVDEDMRYLRGPVTRVEEEDSGIRILADSRADYSKTQGEGGWHYGYRTGVEGDFQPMEQIQTVWGYTWGGVAGHQYLVQSGGSGHPSNGMYVDRRWVSPVAGTVSIDGRFTCNSKKSDGIEVIMLLDGVELARQHVVARPGRGRGDAADFHVTREVTLKEGSVLDILIGPHRSTSYDTTSFTVEVSQPTAAAGSDR